MNSLNQMKEQIKKHYEPPRAEVIALDSQGVLCGSGMRGGNEAYTMDISFTM